MARKSKATFDDDLLDLITQELSDAEQNLDHETPLNYYLGNPRGDEVTGRSQVISTDVADAVEWIMPQIMKSFTQNNEIVIFDPINPEDEFQAELESQYVYEVLMKENDGFIILHQFVKDSLLNNNGFIKVWYEDNTTVKKVKYTGLSKQQLQAALMNPNAELLEVQVSAEMAPIPMSTPNMGQLPPPQPNMGMPPPNHMALQAPPPGPAMAQGMSNPPSMPSAPGSASPPMMPQPMGPPVIERIDAKIAITNVNGRIMIESVAPEDFRINSDHNSINLDNARFAAHLLTKTLSQLREDGVGEEIISELSETSATNRSEFRFRAQNEGVSDSDLDDDSLIEVDIAECYMHSDIDGDGIAERVKVVVAGIDSPTHILDVEEIPSSPWISTTAILMSHKWRGLSMYDRLKSIQDQKTILIRNTLDNIYLQNNQRHLVVEQQVNIDDLMVSRPGGIVRVKTPTAVTPLVTPQVSQDSFVMLKYLDEIRAGRSGVSPEGNASKHSIGERIGSEGLERLMTAKEELVGLIVRVIAETGIKPLCTKIRDLCTTNLDAIRDFKFRGQWQKVDPATWPCRMRSTVRVGTGTGDHKAQLIAIESIIQKQGIIQQIAGQSLVDPVGVFKALDDFAKFSGLNSAVGYFIDPSSPQGKQKAMEAQQRMQQGEMEQKKVAIANLEFQAKLAQAELGKASAQMQNVELKGQVEKAKAQMALFEEQNRVTLERMQQQIDALTSTEKATAEAEKLAFNRDQLIVETALKLTELEVNANKELEQAFLANEEAIEGGEDEQS